MNCILFQKLIGIGFILSSILAIYAFESDKIYWCVTLPLGIWMLFTKKELLIFEDDEESQ